MAFQINGVDIKVSDSEKLDGIGSTGFVQTNSAQALHATDALRVNGSNIELHKANGTSESVAVPSGVDDGSLTLDKFPAPVAGDTYRIADVLGNMVVDYYCSTRPTTSIHSIFFGANTTQSAVDPILSTGSGFSKAFIVRQAGTIRFRGQHNDSGSGTSYMYVAKNGVDVARWSTTSATYQARTVDITVAVGDVIQVGSFNISSDQATQCQQVYFSSSTPAYMAMQPL